MEELLKYNMMMIPVSCFNVGLANYFFNYPELSKNIQWTGEVVQPMQSHSFLQ